MEKCQLLMIGKMNVELRRCEDEPDKVTMHIDGMKDNDGSDNWDKYTRCAPYCVLDSDGTFAIVINADEYCSQYLRPNNCCMICGNWICPGNPMSYEAAQEIIGWLRKCSDRLHEINEDGDENMTEKTYMEIFRETMNPERIDERLKAGEDPLKLVIEKYELIKQAVEAGEDIPDIYYKAEHCALCHVYKCGTCTGCPLNIENSRCKHGSTWMRMYQSTGSDDHVDRIEDLLELCWSLLPKELDLSVLFDGNIPMKEGDVRITVTNKMTKSGIKVQTIAVEGLTKSDEFLADFHDECPYYKTYDSDNEVKVFNEEGQETSVYIKNEREYPPNYVDKFVEALRLAVTCEREIKVRVENERKEWEGRVVTIII